MYDAVKQWSSTCFDECERYFASVDLTVMSLAIRLRSEVALRGTATLAAVAEPLQETPKIQGAEERRSGVSVSLEEAGMRSLLLAICAAAALAIWSSGPRALSATEWSSLKGPSTYGAQYGAGHARNGFQQAGHRQTGDAADGFAPVAHKVPPYAPVANRSFDPPR